MAQLSGLTSRLSGAFRGEQPVFLSDARLVVDALRASDVEAYTFDEVPGLPVSRLENLVMIPVDFSVTPLGKDIEQVFAESAMLVIPIGSFCGTPGGAVYFLEMLSKIDLERCVRGNMAWLDRLETAPSIRMAGHGTDISIQLSDEVFVMAPKTRVTIEPGEWVSVANYLEVGLISHQAGIPPKHVINGTFSAEGIVCASHRYAQREVFPLMAEAWSYLQNLRARHGGAPIVISVEESRPVSITCGDEDVREKVLSFADPDKREFVVEFAFAADAQWDLESVDWTVNSQLNEAIAGLHVGLGNGVSGVHIDFVAPRAEFVS